MLKLISEGHGALQHRAKKKDWHPLHNGMPVSKQKLTPVAEQCVSSVMVSISSWLER